ncbi:MAG: nuclear transport factor 2 family protein [Acidobacteria bacterium]|nr:nuclear transport factor 2 family protein [Acidobacteriota bacterium]
MVLDYPQVKFTDYMSLLKIDGQWWIVNKTFHSEPKTRTMTMPHNVRATGFLLVLLSGGNVNSSSLTDGGIRPGRYRSSVLTCVADQLPITELTHFQRRCRR